MISPTPASMSESTNRAISGRPPSGSIGFGTVYVIGRSRMPTPAARIIAFMRGRVLSQSRGLAVGGTARPRNRETGQPSKVLRREHHILRQIASRAARLSIKIGIARADRLIHVHAELAGHRPDHIHRAFDLEIFADR